LADRRSAPGGMASSSWATRYQDGRLFQQVRDQGGVLYPVSALSLAASDWRRHFDAEWPRLSDAIDRFDPRHLLNPGQGIF
jgi:cytokinin dehydrogenase